MNVPLSRFLVRFPLDMPLDMPPDLVVVSPEPEPQVTIGVAELEARLEAARAEARREAEDQNAEVIARLEGAREQALAEAIIAERAEWAESIGDGAAAMIETAHSDLKAVLAERLAAILRPVVAEALAARTLTALTDAIDRLMADPDQPSLVVKGPLDLLDRIRAVRPAAGVDYQAADTLEISALSDGTFIETRLQAALADIDATETGPQA